MLELTRTQRIAIGSSLAVVCLALGFATVGRRHAPVVAVSGADTISLSAAEAAPAAPSLITVHVVGAVNQPGVVTLAAGSRIWDAVAAAGGFSSAADTQALNLAASVPDGVQICVPEQRRAPAQWTQGPAPADPSQPPYTSPQAEAASAPQPETYAPTPGVTSSWEGQAAEPAAATPAAPAPARAAAGYGAGAPAALGMPSTPGTSARGGVRYPVSLNQADQSELEALPGVGPALAERITRYRATYGPFQRIEDLDNVKGVGPSTLAKIAPYVSL